MTKAAFNKKKASFIRKLDLKLKVETSKVLYLERSFVLCWNLDTSESRSEITWKIWNMLQVKDVEDQVDR